MQAPVGEKPTGAFYFTGKDQAEKYMDNNGKRGFMMKELIRKG